MYSLKLIYADSFGVSHNTGLDDIKDSPKVKLIPMMLRRRLNPAGRMAVGLGLHCLSLLERKPNKIVYASRTGETIRCVKLLKELSTGNCESPSEFAASVHNADVGVLAIASGYHGETTAVAASEDTFYAAITEAALSIYGHGADEVLVICCEESLNQDIMVFPSNCSFHGPYATLFLFGNTDSTASSPFKKDSSVSFVPRCVQIDEKAKHRDAYEFAADLHIMEEQ